MSAILKGNFKLRPEHFKLFSARCFSTELLQKDHESIQKPDPRTDSERVNAKPFSRVPGPTKLGLLRSFLPGGLLYKVPFLDIHKRFRDHYGPIVRFPSLFKRAEFIFLYEPVDFEKVFRTEGIWPVRLGSEAFIYFHTHVRPDVYKGSAGLANAQGKPWADLRTKANPILLKPKILKHHLPEVDETARDFLKRIEEILDPKTKETPADFSKEVGRWTLEATGVFAINTRLGLIGNADPTDGEKRMNSMKMAFQLVYELEILPSISRYYKTPKFYKLMDAWNDVTNINIKHVNEALRKYDEKKLKDPNYEPEGVLEQLVEVDRRAAVLMAIDMLMAGIDTTSSLFLGVLYRIAKSPKAQDKLRQEVLTALPEKDSMLTPEKMANLPYLRACIKETLRMVPVVGGNVRGVGEDLVLSGYQIPKSTTVIMANILLTQDEKYFPQTEKFLPERWLRDTTKTDGCPSARDVNPFVYLPFGFGPRMCIGKRIAEMMIEVAICRILRNYRVSWDHPDMEYESNIIFRPGGDLKFKMEKIV